MIRKFLKDKRGNYAMITAMTMAPLMGALAISIDYTEMTAQRQQTINALDAAGLATANRLAEGATDTQALAYAQDFFKANLGHVDPANAALTVVLPNNNAGGGTLKMSAALQYKPYFIPAAKMLMGKTGGDVIYMSANSEIRLKNTLEVSLVLDNSGSMTELGVGSSKVRFDLLKDAAKQLVDQLASQAQQMKQVDKPVQFSLVPFAASVNVGPANATASWMDTTGISPIQHENFDWTTMPQTTTTTCSDSTGKCVQKVGTIWYARGTGWDATQKDKPLTRFSLYNLMQRMTGSHTEKTGTQTCTTVKKVTTCVDDTKTVNDYAQLAAWTGCVEARPYPYNVQDDAASTSTPATMFVPMFAPDETDKTDSNSRPANNNWRYDGATFGTTSKVDDKRQRYMPKYFTQDTSVTTAYASDEGPNVSCSTKPITPLTDVSTTAGANVIKAAIDAMAAKGATNVPEGMAWGWRTLSSGLPFNQGRSEVTRGTDKVVIVLTDGANTYYTPTSVVGQSYSGTNYKSGGNDLAGSKAIYSSLGYLKPYNNGYSYGRAFLGTSTSISKTDYSNANYTKAMNEHFATLCANAKAGNLIVMTIGLDLDSKDTAEATQIAALKACSSDSRFRKDATDPTKPAKLFWNSTGATLSNDFKEIGNELSNLRIVS